MALALGIDEGGQRQSRPLVVLLHGFPELPSSWRHQVGPLVAAGHRVVAPYLRGYGDSPSPTDVAAYTLDHLAGDVAEVVEGCGEQQAVIIGHDWGAMVAWATAQLRPDRVLAVAGLSVPYQARTRTPPIERMRQLAGEHFFYMLYFQEPGVAESELEPEMRRFLLSLYASSSGKPAAPMKPLLAADGKFLDQLTAPATFPEWLDPNVFEDDVHVFERTGLRGPLSYYRAIDLSWHALPQLADARLTMPAAFIAGELDPVLAFAPLRTMAPPWVTDLRIDRRIPGVGHWVQQEAPEPVTRALLDLLDTV